MVYVGLALFVLSITAPVTTGTVTVWNPGLEDLVLSDPGDFAIGNILVHKVGQRLDFPLSSYTVALIANGATLVPDSSLNAAPDTSHTDTIINDSGSDSAQLGQNLEIQLSASTGRRADFGNVLPKAPPTRPLPEPPSLVLLVIGLVCLLLYPGRRCANRGFYQHADVKLCD